MKKTLVPTRELQKILGCTRIALARLIEAGLPVAKRGAGGRSSLFNLEAVAAWLLAERRARAHTEPKRSAALAQWRTARARTAELELEEAKSSAFDPRVAAIHAEFFHRVLRLEFPAIVERWPRASGVLGAPDIYARVIAVELPELDALRAEVAPAVAEAIGKAVAELGAFSLSTTAPVAEGSAAL